MTLQVSGSIRVIGPFIDLQRTEIPLRCCETHCIDVMMPRDIGLRFVADANGGHATGFIDDQQRLHVHRRWTLRASS